MSTSFTKTAGVGFGRPPVSFEQPDVLGVVGRRIADVLRSDPSTAPAPLSMRRGGKQSLVDLSELAAISMVLCAAGFAAVWATPA